MLPKDYRSPFKTLNKLVGNVKEEVFPCFLTNYDIAHELAEFYLDKVLKIRQSLDHKDVLESLTNDSLLDINNKNTCPNMDTFTPVSTSQVMNYIRALNSKTSSHDPIPTVNLKQCAEVVSTFLTFLINASLHSSEFPAVLKHAIVTPAGHGMEWNGIFSMEYGRCQNGMEWKISRMEWKISRMEWKTIFHTSIPIPY